MASDGARVLLVDLNGQGNIAQVLGFANSAADDKGRNLFSAVTAGVRLAPVQNVRPNLDVVPGGNYVRRIATTLAAEMGTSRDTGRLLLSLADALQAVASQYKLIIIDSPPENPLLLQLALCAARWVVVPMRTNGASEPGCASWLATFAPIGSIIPTLYSWLCLCLRRGPKRQASGADSPNKWRKTSAKTTT